jgi:hypothetical protein
MIRRSTALLALLASFPLVASLASCGLYTRPTSEDREARQDCDAEADRIFAVRNRYQMSERDSTNTPYAGNTLPSNPTAGLSDQYEEDKLVDSCLAHGTNAAASANAAPSGTPPAPAPAPAPAPLQGTPR